MSEDFLKKSDARYCECEFTPWGTGIFVLLKNVFHLCSEMYVSWKHFCLLEAHF